MNARDIARCAVIAAVVAWAGASGVAAQPAGNSVPNALQGFSQNRNQPVQIEAARLEVRDKDRKATFSGRV
jgi:lipopolysaccharide export system protein LptA